MYHHQSGRKLLLQIKYISNQSWYKNKLDTGAFITAQEEKTRVYISRRSWSYKLVLLLYSMSNCKAIKRSFNDFLLS